MTECESHRTLRNFLINGKAPSRVHLEKQLRAKRWKKENLTGKTEWNAVHARRYAVLNNDDKALSMLNKSILMCCFFFFFFRSSQRLIKEALSCSISTKRQIKDYLWPLWYTVGENHAITTMSSGNTKTMPCPKRLLCSQQREFYLLLCHMETGVYWKTFSVSNTIHLKRYWATDTWHRGASECNDERRKAKGHSSKLFHLPWHIWRTAVRPRGSSALCAHHEHERCQAWSTYWSGICWGTEREFYEEWGL